MRKQIVAGNWKMNGDKASIEALLTGVKQNAAELSAVELIVFPSDVYLSQVQDLLGDSNIAWGAQNVSANEPGAYTGETAAQMLNDFSCGYVLIGHSERRHIYGEDNTQCALKFAQAKRHGLVPVFCVGETQEQRECGETEQVIQQQLQSVLELDAGAQGLQNAVIAYEPVWAIGTGLTASPEQAQAVHAFIRSLLAEQDSNIAQQTPLLYGGSVKAANAKNLFVMTDIDGGLVGGASLDAHEFVEIAKCIN